MEPRAKEWMLATARGDYHAIARLLREEPRLARRRVSSKTQLLSFSLFFFLSYLLVRRFLIVSMHFVRCHILLCFHIFSISVFFFSCVFSPNEPVRFSFFEKKKKKNQNKKMTYVCVLTFVDKRVVVTVNFEWWDDDAHSPPHFSFSLSLSWARCWWWWEAHRKCLCWHVPLVHVFSSLPSACVRVCNAFISRIHRATFSNVWWWRWWMMSTTSSAKHGWQISMLSSQDVPLARKGSSYFSFYFRVCVCERLTLAKMKKKFPIFQSP